MAVRLQSLLRVTERVALSPMASICIALAIVVRGVSIGLLLRHPVAMRVAPRPSSLRSHPMHPGEAALVDVIVKAHLFGVAMPDSSDTADVPTSATPLILTGTFATPEPDHGFAILGDAVESAKLYPAGARIGNGAILQQVFADHVVLNRGGQLEKIKMLDRAAAAGGPDRHSPRAASLMPAPVAAAADPDASSASVVVHMKKFALLPVYGDRNRGARIGLPKDPAEFGRTGLRPGDVITAINGVAVHSAQSAASLLNDSAGGSVRLTVQRGAATENLVVDALE
jgi:general secretion pathway protein C